MSHAIFAGTTTARLPWILDALEQAGYRSEEVSIVTSAAAASSVPAAKQLPWQIDHQPVFSTGPLTAHFTQRFAATLSAALHDYGLPAYAVRHCESMLARDEILIAVHTTNGFEVEPLSDLLHESGCDYLTTVAGVLELLAA